MTAIPRSSTLRAILSFMSISSIRKDLKGSIDDVAKYVNWK